MLYEADRMGGEGKKETERSSGQGEVFIVGDRSMATRCYIMLISFFVGFVSSCTVFLCPES